MIAPQPLDSLDPQQMRQALLGLMAEMTVKDQLLERRQREVAFKQAQVDKLTHEFAAQLLLHRVGGRAQPTMAGTTGHGFYPPVAKLEQARASSNHLVSAQQK